MSKGIRPFVNASFAKHLVNLAELGNTGFRRAVMQETMQEFNISALTAATHYNFSLKQQRANNPASVIGVGRPENKKGGRKVIHGVTVVKAKTGEVVAEGVSSATAQTMIATAVSKKKAKLMILTAVSEEVA
jgi:hypothetical protein